MPERRNCFFFLFSAFAASDYAKSFAFTSAFSIRYLLKIMLTLQRGKVCVFLAAVFAPVFRVRSVRSFFYGYSFIVVTERRRCFRYMFTADRTLIFGYPFIFAIGFG